MLRRAVSSHTFALLMIVLLAFAIRVYHLDAQSLWYDEGVTAEIARRGLVEMTRWTAGDIQPPLYYYTVAGWGRLAGWSEWSLRYPSAFFGVLLIPLLATTASALTRRRTAGTIVALLAAIHPLLVYYSQEARMYAMLTTLGVLLGYLTIHGENRIRRRWLHWTLYVIVATAAVYTHYFAFFLLFTLAAAFFMDQWWILPATSGAPNARQCDADIARSDVDPPMRLLRAPISGFVAANCAVLFLYTPWFTALFSRLNVDSSYWQGNLKLEEALRHVAISFTSGESVLEENATLLLPLYGLATIVATLALVFYYRSQGRSLMYSLLWLALPTSAVLYLATLVPKFNARYVMVALPGLLVLWSGGIVHLSDPVVRLMNRHRHTRAPGALPGSPTTQSAAGPSQPNMVSFAITRVVTLFLTLVSIVLTGGLLVGFAISDYNWFTNPAFTKSEWRELTNFIRTTNGKGNPDDDLVVLVSGHAWPVWNYYAPDMPPLRMPNLQVLDVNAVLDFASTATPLRDALVGKDNVWLVEWQEEIVDPMNIVPLQLQLAGREQAVDAEFWQLRLRHFANVESSRILVEPTVISPESINFGNQIYLVDYTIADNDDLLLFWQLHPEHSQPVPDLNLTGNTFTSDGLPFMRVTDRRPSSYEYPPFRWQEEQITLGRIPAQEWAGPGALPGTYRIRLGVYDVNGDMTGIDVMGPEGQPLGKHIILDLNLNRPTKGPDVADDEKGPFAEIIPDLFVQIGLAAEQAEPGQTVAVESLWYAEETPVADYDLSVRWRLRANNSLMGEQIMPLSRQWRTSRWPDDELLRSYHLIRPPLNLAPDDYWLEVGLRAPGSSYVRVPFRILGSTRLYVAPPYATKVGVAFGDWLYLLGIIEPLQVVQRAGQQIALTLIWRAIDRMPADYSVSVQWLDSEQKPAAQIDLALPGGSSNWLPQQIELQTVIATTPPDPGIYRLVAAVYDATSPELTRLYTEAGNDLIDLGQVRVEP